MQSSDFIYLTKNGFPFVLLYRYLSVKKEAMNRIRYIDALKGFAAICVVLGHVANGYLVEGAADGLYYGLFNAVYVFHMPLFFAISGFLFGRIYFRDGQVNRDKIRAQVIHLACLYVFYSLLLGVSKIIFSRYVANQVSPMALLLIPVKPLELYWYLYVLMIYYFVFSREAVVRQKSAVIFAVTLALGAASWWIPRGWLFDADRLLYHPLFFYLGITLNKKPGLLEKKAAVFALLPCILSLYILFWNGKTPLHQTLIVNQALGVACTVFLFAAFSQCRLPGENPFFLFIGKYSLEIYLLHTFVLTACRALFHRMNLENPVLIILISTAAGLALPILFTAACKKMGIYSLLFNPYKSRLRKGK